MKKDLRPLTFHLSRIWVYSGAWILPYLLMSWITAYVFGIPFTTACIFVLGVVFSIALTVFSIFAFAETFDEGNNLNSLNNRSEFPVQRGGFSRRSLSSPDAIPDIRGDNSFWGKSQMESVKEEIKERK